MNVFVTVLIKCSPRLYSGSLHKLFILLLLFHLLAETVGVFFLYFGEKEERSVALWLEME